MQKGKLIGKIFGIALVGLMIGAMFGSLPAFVNKVEASPATEIWDWYDLDAIRNNLDGNYVLMDDLDSTTAGYEELASLTANGGKGWEPIGSFNGTFDGQGYEIHDLFINRPSESDVGLFGSVDEGGVIQNIGVVNATVRARSRFGGLVGSNDGIVMYSYSVGSVSGGYETAAVGGLVGYNSGTVRYSYSAGSVIGYGGVGGLVGRNEHLVSNSYSSASVTGSTYEYACSAGGLVGDGWGVIKYCYSTGRVAGNQRAGGLKGWDFVTYVEESFWDTETSGITTSYGGTGKTTAEMKNIATFSEAAWDIIAVAFGETNDVYTWNIIDGETYPFLSGKPALIEDVTPPAVSSVSPEDDDTDVSINTIVTAIFSEAMDASTITTDTFTLAGSAVSGTVTYDPVTYTATFTPNADLVYDHEYTATLSTAITDLAGNPLTAAYSWSFTTVSSDDIYWLAKAIASEAGSVWDVDHWVRCSDEERSAVGWTVLNRLASGEHGKSIKEVVTEDANGDGKPDQYAFNQEPTSEIRELANKLLKDQIPDLTGGATHFFSPISMPKEGESTEGFDVGGGLHEVPGIEKRVYFPSWTTTLTWVGDLDNVRRAYFMFYRSKECVLTVTGTGTAYFTPNHGTIEDLTAVATPSAPPVVLPHGMFSFKVTGLTPGQPVSITIELPEPAPVGTEWWKYHAGSWYSLPIGDDDGDKIITITLTDGVFPGDTDGIAGQITDPGGPGNPGSVGWETYPVNKVRVLLPWIALLAFIMAGASLLVLRWRGRDPEHT